MSSGSAPARGPGRRSDVPGWAELWQVPLFCLGLAAFVTVLLLRPAEGTDRSTLRDAYEKALAALDDADLAAARKWIKAVTDVPHQDRITLLELHFLKGSLLLAEARRLHPLPVEKPEGYAVYRAALLELKEANTAGAKHTPPRLGYRFALAQAGSEPLSAMLLDHLEQTLEADFADRSDGNRLLATLRLRLTPPDYAGAVRAIDQLLLVPQLPEPNAWRLKKVEHLTQLAKWQDVAKAAAAIPGDAEESSRAVQLQALAAFHQQQWGEAAGLFAGVPPRQMTPSSLLHQGLCLQKLKKLPEAERAWERLWREYVNSPEAIRAQLSLAELAFDQSNWREAVRSLLAVLTSQKPTEFTNPYVTVEDLKRLVIKVGERLTTLSRWEDVCQLATAAQPWGLGGRAETWLARAWHALATAGTASVSREQAYARAAEYAYRAAGTLSGTEKQTLLHQAGQDALQAKAPQQAHRALGELLALPPDPPVRPLVLIDLAQALAEQKQVPDACARLREAIQLPGPHEAKARLRLAKLFLEEKRYAEAELELEPAAALVTRPAASPEAMEAAHQWAIFLYRDVVDFHSPRILQAVNAAEKALTYAAQHRLAAQTRYLLGELLLIQAEPHKLQEDILRADPSVLSQRAAKLWQACQHFQAASEDLLKPEAELVMSKSDALRNAHLGQADCLYGLGVLREFATDAVPPRDTCYRDAARLFETAAFQQKQAPDSLYALLFLARCQQKRGNFTQARETLRDALQQLERMSDAELAAPSRLVSYPREAWARLLKTELDQVP